MQLDTRVAQEVTAPHQVGAVVHVATVGGAPAGAHDARVPQLRQVVRDEVLRLADEVDELAHATVAATELADELPAQRIGQETEDLRRLRRLHARDYIKLN
jgi:hypothetical protein